MNNIYMSVAELRKALNGLPDDMPVMYQRIEDMYFETHGWKGKELNWDYNNHTSEYVHVFSAYKHPDEDESVFVMNAHY